MAKSAAKQPIIEPWDRYNQELVNHAHPPDWRNPDPASRYNLVVIGVCTAGLVCAAGAAGRSLQPHPAHPPGQIRFFLADGLEATK
jgi:hypothetical protein